MRLLKKIMMKSASRKLKMGMKKLKSLSRLAPDAGIEVTASVVTGFDKIHYVNVEECEKIASSLGAKFRNREFIENGY